jgi:hypothetical protein
MKLKISKPYIWMGIGLGGFRRSWSIGAADSSRRGSTEELFTDNAHGIWMRPEIMT